LFVNFFFSASMNIHTRGVQAKEKIGSTAGKASGKFCKKIKRVGSDKWSWSWELDEGFNNTLTHFRGYGLRPNFQHCPPVFETGLIHQPQAEIALG